MYYIIANVWVCAEAKPRQTKKLSPPNSSKQVIENPPVVVDHDTSSTLALNHPSPTFDLLVIKLVSTKYGLRALDPKQCSQMFIKKRKKEKLYSQLVYF